MGRDEGPAPEDRSGRIERALQDYFLAADAGGAPRRAEGPERHPQLQPELGELLAMEEGLDRIVEPLVRERPPADTADEITTTRPPVKNPGPETTLPVGPAP